MENFVVIVNEHRYLGYILTPYIIEKTGAFYTCVKPVKNYDLESFDYTFTPVQAKIVNISEKYSDTALAKRFSKTKNTNKFYDEVDKSFFDSMVAPVIDKYILEIYELICEYGIKLYLKKNKFSNLFDEDEIKTSDKHAKAVYNFERGDEGTKYYLTFLQNGKPIKLIDKQVIFLTSEPCLMVYENEIFNFEHISSKKLLPFLEKDHIFVGKAVEQKYYETFVKKVVAKSNVNAVGFDIVEELPNHHLVLNLETNLKEQLVLSPIFMYGNTAVSAINSKRAFVEMQISDKSVSFRKFVRNKTWEDRMFSYLESLRLTKTPTSQLILDGSKALELTEQKYETIEWIKSNLPNLETKGISLNQDSLANKYNINEYNVKFDIKQSDNKSDWFDLNAFVQIGEFSIPFLKFRKNIVNEIREYTLPDGSIVILPEEWFSQYKDLFSMAKLDGDKILLKHHHLQLIEQKPTVSKINAAKDLYLSDAESISKVAIPASIQAKLRHYQKEGYRWLYNLAEKGFGGCLADDMGLGKTLQAITLIQKTINKAKEEKPENTIPASLVVAPVSLLKNWENEFKKFAPNLKVKKNHGTNRIKSYKAEKLHSKYDVLISTYGTIRNDIDELEDIEFLNIVLDESQIIKNTSSKIYKAATRLKSKHKYVLTGTPIENSLMDLWAQLNFLNPGLLGSQAYFKREFVAPIEKHSDEAKQDRLSLLIRPFILRRSKSEVLTELPPVTETIVYCEMSEEQSSMYEKEKSSVRNMLLEQIDSIGIEKSSVLILQALNKLRQLANHPKMIDTDIDGIESGKMEEIMQSLENVVSIGHKVLLFSSFVKHLNLLSEEIDKRGWGWSMLTGSTKNRPEVINEFQNNPDKSIFLISLKAGGVGLNLTVADYVFIVDPWWNPAAEMQAIGRAHRIGQENKVFVYRYISTDTIEEKILKLQEHKDALAKKFIDSNNPMKKMNKDEIMSLFT
ncbi:MAG: SNF2-related protein [Bacteroidales bacterium]